MQNYEEHKNSHLAFTAGLADWGPTAHIIASATRTCRKQLQPLPPCRTRSGGSLSQVSRGHGGAVKAALLCNCDFFSFFLWNTVLSQTAAPMVLYLWLGAADSWVFILIRREISEQYLTPFPACLLLLFPLQIFCNKWVSPLLPLCSIPCRISCILLSKVISLLYLRVLLAGGYSWSCRVIQRGSKPSCWHSFLFLDVKELYYFVLSLLETSLSVSNWSKILKWTGFFPCLYFCGQYNSIQKERSFSSTEKHLYSTLLAPSLSAIAFLLLFTKG